MPSWYDPNWKFRQRVTVDHTKAAGALTDFTIPIQVTDLGNPIFARALLSGFDIVVTAADGVTPLAFERSVWDPVGKRLVLYVKIPSLSATADTVLYIYYGCRTSFADRQAAADAWDAHFQAIYHFEELPFAGLLRDSLGVHHGAITPGTTRTARIPAAGTGRAWQFDGTDHVEVTPILLSPTPAEVTIEFVSRITNPAIYGIVFSALDYPGNKIVAVWEQWRTPNQFSFQFRDTEDLLFSVDHSVLRHFAGTAVPGGKKTAYLDGLQMAQADFSGWHDPDVYHTTWIAGSPETPNLACQISELRVSMIARSAAWVATTHASLLANSTFIGLAAEEAYSPPYRPSNMVTPSAVFPELPGLAWSIGKKLSWRTLIQEAESGAETRAALWSYPRRTWTLTYDELSSDELEPELQALIGFFNQRRGSFESFLFRDDDDCGITGQLIGVGDGEMQAFQMCRTLGGFTEPVFSVAGSPTIYLDGAPQASGWTLDPDGVLYFAIPPAAGVQVTADFGFYWRVRFVQDETEFDYFMYLLYEAKKIELISLKGNES